MSHSPMAIVTGGAQGIGAAICKELLKLGYKVCIADIQVEKGRDLVLDLQKEYGVDNVTFCRCDVTTKMDLVDTFRVILHFYKKVDLLVNNAGIALEDPIRMLQVNLFGPIIGCQTALEFMGKSNGGQGGMVINTASTAGLLPIPGMEVYAASKHGVVGLTRSYGVPSSFEKDGIVFAALCPSITDTDMSKNVREQKLLEGIPDRWGAMMSTEYAAKGVVKLLEDRINGSTLMVTPAGYEYVGYPKELKGKLLLD